MSSDTTQRVVLALERIASALERLAKMQVDRRANPPPEHGASLDMWLAWRDAERAHGQKCTLARVAQLSGHSLSTVKKRAAERRKM